MKTISKIIYTIIVCRFLMNIRGRFKSKVPIDPTKCLLIEYLPEANVALLFGYANNAKEIHNLMCDLRVHGFETLPDAQMAVVHPLGNNMFKYINSEERIGPCRLCSTSRGRWYDVVQKHGMRREVIDSMCGMK